MAPSRILSVTVTFSELEISSNLASYLAFAHRPNTTNTTSLESYMSVELQQQLEKEYLKLKGNRTVEELYGILVPRYDTV